MTHYLEREIARLEEPIPDQWEDARAVRNSPPVTERIVFSPAPLQLPPDPEEGRLIRCQDGTCLQCARRGCKRWKVGRFGFRCASGVYGCLVSARVLAPSRSSLWARASGARESRMAGGTPERGFRFCQRNGVNSAAAIHAFQRPQRDDS